MSTASNIMESIMKTVPLEWILPVVFQKVLDSIKNPNSSNAKVLKKVLVPFGQSLAQKYPGEICPTQENSSDT